MSSQREFNSAHQQGGAYDAPMKCLKVFLSGGRSVTIELRFTDTRDHWMRDNIAENKAGKVVLQDINGDITTYATDEIIDVEEEIVSPPKGSTWKANSISLLRK